MGHSFQDVEGSHPPASAYAALTASGKLQHLDINHCTLPAGAAMHLFSAGKQLPDLRSLDIGGVNQPTREYATAPEGSRLVSCCPWPAVDSDVTEEGASAVQYRAAGITAGAERAACCNTKFALCLAKCHGRGCACGVSADRTYRASAAGLGRVATSRMNINELLLHLTQLKHWTKLHVDCADGI
jgi:hypothetical protein